MSKPVGQVNAWDPRKDSGLVFDDLKAFVMVARHGSFAQAAADLCIAQSALSKRVQRLETRLGTPLLARHARGVLLTEAGSALVARAQRLVDEVTDIERNLSSLVQTPAGEVRIALPQRTCGLLAPPLIEHCRRELPLVELQVLEGTPANVHGWLMHGEADLAMTYNPDLGTGFIVEPFLVEPLFLFVSPEFAAERLPSLMADASAPCSLADLTRLPLILPRKPDVVRVLVNRLCAGRKLRPNIVYETDGMTTIRGMVERGMGVTIFSLSTSWSDAVAAGRLVALPFASTLMNWKMYLVQVRKDASVAAIDRVNAIVREEIGLLLASGAWPNATRIVSTDGTAP